MFPKFDEVAHQHVLDRVGEDAPPLDDSLGEDAEILLEQDDVGRVLGHVGCGVDGDTDVGVVQGDRVVDAVAEEPDIDAERPLCADDARLLLRGDAGEDRGLGKGGDQLDVAELLYLGTGERLQRGHAEVGADLLGHPSVVAGDEFDRDTELRQPLERGSGVRLWRIGEAEVATQFEVAFVGRRESQEIAGGSRGDGDHTATGCEQPLECRFCSVRDSGAAGEDHLRRPFGDEQPSVRSLGEHRAELALMVEGRPRHPPPPVGARTSSPRC